VEHSIIRIDAGEYTEELAKFIANGLNDDQLDLIDLDRERKELPGVAQEPITIALIIGVKVAAEAGAAAVGVAAVVTVGKLIEKWMDQAYHSRKLDQAIIISEFDPDLGKLLLKDIKKFAQVSVEHEMQPTLKAD
jgi:hypothetical protein